MIFIFLGPLPWFLQGRNERGENQKVPDQLHRMRLILVNQFLVAQQILKCNERLTDIDLVSAPPKIVRNKSRQKGLILNQYKYEEEQIRYEPDYRDSQGV